MGKLLKTRFSTAVVVLIPACIGMNYLGKFFATLLKLPLWLDSIGTCMGACLGGPIVGALCGAFNNLIYGLTTGDNITLIYSLTSAGIGFFVGHFDTAQYFVLGRYYGQCLGRCIIWLDTGKRNEFALWFLCR